MTSINLGWIGIGALIILGSSTVAWDMFRFARSDRVLKFMYGDQLRFRRELHMKPADPFAFRRGTRAGFMIASAWGLAGVAVGVGLIVGKGF
jgi:hypothetical protein